MGSGRILGGGCIFERLRYSQNVYQRIVSKQVSPCSRSHSVGYLHLQKINMNSFNCRSISGKRAPNLL